MTHPESPGVVLALSWNTTNPVHRHHAGRTDVAGSRTKHVRRRPHVGVCLFVHQAVERERPRWPRSSGHAVASIPGSDIIRMVTRYVCCLV
jgi:hypothetical protein|eukprot:COSAG01_NODE_6783_length_3500_cov_13.742135_2_plen_91_part_00